MLHQVQKQNHIRDLAREDHGKRRQWWDVLYWMAIVMGTQLSLFSESQPEWVTGASVDREGLAAFTILIRSPDDPERGDIRKMPEHLRDRKAEWLRKMKKMPVDVAAEMIFDLLGDGYPRTFNRISVELWDKTADVLFEQPPFHAIWKLVADKRIEHTMRSPVLFRRCDVIR